MTETLHLWVFLHCFTNTLSKSVSFLKNCSPAGNIFFHGEGLCFYKAIYVIQWEILLGLSLFTVLTGVEHFFSTYICLTSPALR